MTVLIRFTGIKTETIYFTILYRSTDLFSYAMHVIKHSHIIYYLRQRIKIPDNSRLSNSKST